MKFDSIGYTFWLQWLVFKEQFLFRNNYKSLSYLLKRWMQILQRPNDSYLLLSNTICLDYRSRNWPHLMFVIQIVPSIHYSMLHIYDLNVARSNIIKIISENKIIIINWFFNIEELYVRTSYACLFGPAICAEAK